MFEKLADLFKKFCTYGVSSIIAKFLNYLLVPLYTYTISAESGGYGIVTNLYAYTALLLVMLTFGMETTFQWRVNKEDVEKEDIHKQNKIFSTAALSVGFVCLLFVTLVSLFLKPIAGAMGYEAHPEFVEIMAVIVSLDAFQAIFFTYLRQQNRAAKFVILKLTSIIINIGLNLFVFLAAPVMKGNHPGLMSWYNPDYQVGYIFIVNLISTSLVTFGFIPELAKLRYGIDRKFLKQMLNYTWPILLMGIAGILNHSADKICYRIIMPGPEGETQLGIYGACVKIAVIITVINQAFRYAFEPHVFNDKNDKECLESQGIVMKYFVIFNMMAFLAVVMFLPALRYIIKADYWGGLTVVPIVMLAEIFFGIYFNFSFWYKKQYKDQKGNVHVEKPLWGALFSGVGCVLVLAINFIFVPKYGYRACAWGALIGPVVCMLLSYFVGRKQLPELFNLYDLKNAFLYFALAIALFFVQKFIHLNNPVWTLLVNTCLLLVYVAFFCWMERALVTKVLKRIKVKLLK